MSSFSEEAVAVVWYRDCDNMHSSVLLNVTMWPLVYGSCRVGAHVGTFSSMMLGELAAGGNRSSLAVLDLAHTSLFFQIVFTWCCCLQNCIKRVKMAGESGGP